MMIPPRISAPRASLGLVHLFLAAALLSAGCTATAPPAGQPAATAPPVATGVSPPVVQETPALQGTPAGQVTVTPTTAARDYLVHIAGKDKGYILLVGRSTCPWCLLTKDLLANMSVDYWWVDLNTLDQAETSEVMAPLASVKGCEKITAVPILVVRGERCIIGYQEQVIRGAIG